MQRSDIGMEKALRYETRAPLVATGREMKVGLVLSIVVLAAASVVAYARPEMSATLSLAASGIRLSEPGVMLISGSALLVVAGALRRMRV